MNGSQRPLKRMPIYARDVIYSECVSIHQSTNRQWKKRQVTYFSGKASHVYGYPYFRRSAASAHGRLRDPHFPSPTGHNYIILVNHNLVFVAMRLRPLSSFWHTSVTSNASQCHANCFDIRLLLRTHVLRRLDQHQNSSQTVTKPASRHARNHVFYYTCSGNTPVWTKLLALEAHSVFTSVLQLNAIENAGTRGLYSSPDKQPYSLSSRTHYVYMSSR